MLTGWKAISEYTGLSRNTLRRLRRDDGFPIVYIATKPITTRSQIEDWIRACQEKKGATRCQEVSGGVKT